MREQYQESQLSREARDKSKQALMLELADRSERIYQLMNTVVAGNAEPGGAMRDALSALNENSQLVRKYADISQEEYDRFLQEDW
jgi:hypothetical protein